MIRAAIMSGFMLVMASPAFASETAPAMPDELVAEFTRAQRTLSYFDSCPNSVQQLSANEVVALANRLIALELQASGIWGNSDASQLVELPEEAAIRCSRDNWSALVRTTTGQLDAVTARLEAALEPMQSGAWLGALPLCAAGPVQVVVGKNDYDDRPTLAIRLNAAAAGRLAAVTRAHVGHSLALRIDGTVVMQPMINEPIEGGELVLSGGEREEYERLAQSLHRCGRAAQSEAPAI
jgi:hypothetical protein